MSSLIDIARSGVMAYRTALSVTTENVANANTAGYVRREAVLNVNAGASMTPDTPATLGGGVSVGEVRRAFDALTAQRLWSSESALGAAQAQATAGQALEQRLMLGADGIKSAMTEFFGGMNDLASQPADTGLRRIALQKAETLANSFAEAGKGLQVLREDALGALRLAAGKVSDILNDLSATNRQMMAVQTPEGAANGLHDRRDALLKNLSAEIGVSVALDAQGQAEVRLGGLGGPVLLDRAGASKISLTGETPPQLTMARPGIPAVATPVTVASGQIAGHLAALAGINAAEDELDQLAAGLAAALNAAQASGLDLDGQKGAALLSLEGVEVYRNATNSGLARVEVTGLNPATRMTLGYDGSAGEWRLSDVAGNLLARGASVLSYQGTTLTVQGTPRNGDSFTLVPRSGRAADMALALTDPRQFAAAAATISAAAPGNSGSATASILAAGRPASTLAPIGTVLSGSGAASATGLIQPGVVGVIPAGTSAADLVSFGRQASADFLVPDANLANGGVLRLSLGGTVESFAVPAGLDAAQVANALNDGSILTATGQSLAAFGVHAAGTSGQLSLAAAQGDFASAALVLPTGTVPAVLVPSEPRASGLMVFTRDGRQVAGSPLAADAAARLLTVANGFEAGARYQAEALNGAAGSGYRGMSVDRMSLLGAQSVTVDAGTLAAGPLTLRTAETAATIAVPEGVSAARLAARIDGALPGVSAQAETALSLSGISDGRVEFSLTGSNASPVAISALVEQGDLSALARAVNSAGAATGITAELSEDGARLRLRQAGGEDIRIEAFAHQAGGQMTVTPLDMQGAARGGASLLSASGVTALRLVGQVALSAPGAFSVVTGGTAQTSQPDPVAGGVLRRVTEAAGDVVRLRISADPSADAAGVSPDGLTVAAAGWSQSLTVNGVSVTHQGATSPETAADGLLVALRAAAPQAALTGTAVTSLPPAGAAMALRLDGADYVLRMQAGQPVIDGPEQGRLSAAFDASGRLQVTVTGGVPDGIGVVADSTSPWASSFGLAQGAMSRLTGLPVDPASLPANGQSIALRVGGTDYALEVNQTGGSLGLTVPPDFPGVARVDDQNRIVIEAPVSAGQVQVLPGAALAGLGSAGVGALRSGEELVLTSATGSPPQIGFAAQSTAAERLRLTDLPPEDLIVVMAGNGGALRLGGSLTPASGAPQLRATELRVIDAAAGAVELFDRDSGHSIASGWLDARGQAELGGYRISLAGRAADGDRFVLAPNLNPAGDGRGALAMAALADAESAGGSGFARMLADLTADVGARAHAANLKQETEAAGHETLSRKIAEIGAVDLDAEAARLIELQQAYQASAQTLTIARQLFDTILSIM